MERNDPPFQRGKTRWEGSPPDATQGGNFEGRTYEFEDIDFSLTTSEVKVLRSGRTVRCMVVRNLAGVNLVPKDLAKMKTDGSGLEFLGQVMSNNPTLGDLCFPIDEWLPAAGVVANDLFYVVVEGPATVKTDTAGDTNIAIGNHVIPGATTAGRVIDQDKTVAAGTATFNQIQGAVGVAIKAVNATSTDLLIDVGGSVKT